MNEQTQKLIETLSTKLGTTAEHLWSVLVKQAPISATIDATLFGLLVAFSIWWARLVIKKTTGNKEWDYEEGLMAKLSAGALCLLCFVLTASCLGDVLAGFFNPEYWALKQLLPK